MADQNLTHSAQEKAYIANTHPGQFYFAGSGPDGAKCASCGHWEPETKPASKADMAFAKAQGLPPPPPSPTGFGACGKLRRNRRPKFSGTASACKYFATPEKVTTP